MSLPDQPQSRDEAPPARTGPDPLPFATVEWLWARLGVRYGHQLTARWEGFEIPVVKEDWRYELAGLSDQQLSYGLDRLPPRFPPDAGEFRKLCEAMPQVREATPIPKLPAPRSRMELRPEIRAAIAQLLEPPPPGQEPHRIVVARRFVAKWEGAALSPQQRSDLAYFRRLIERHERVAEDVTAAAKARAQEAADTYQQEHADAAPGADH